MLGKLNFMFYITHIYPEGLPLTGLRKLAFITTMEIPGEYFLGTDNNPLTEEEINNWVAKNQLVPLQYKVALPEKKSLWVDSVGLLFFGDSYNSEKRDSKEIAVYDAILGKIFQEEKLSGN